MLAIDGKTSLMRKVIALSHPNRRLTRPVFKLPAGWIQLDQITNDFIDELLQVSALRDALKSAPKRWCFIYGSFLKKRSLNELENMHDLDVLAISKSDNTENVFNGDNTKHLPVKMRDTSLNLSLDYNAFISKAPYDVDSMGRNWAESLAFKVSYNEDSDTVDACLVTFSNAFKVWLEATHDKPIAYHQIPEILNTNGTYFDVLARLERAMENKDLIDARQFFLLNKSQLKINQFKRNEGEFIQNESEYSQNGLGLIETEIADFLGYFFNRSIVFSHFKFSKNMKKEVEAKTREILSIIEKIPTSRSMKKRRSRN